MNKWHQLQAEEVLKIMKTSATAGLSESEANRLLQINGNNELVGTGVRSPWLILWEQLSELMVAILIGAAILSALFDDYADAVAITAIVILNTILGFSQEYRAEQAMAALKKLSVPIVRVRRDGQTKEISALKLVPGDVVLLEAGNFVPADCRLFECADLQIHEAALTGESEPIRKITAPIAQSDVAVGDRLNMVYMGTAITSGRGMAVVTETGMHTELGHIATLIHTVGRESTPLQGRLEHLGKRLATVALLLVLLIFALGLLRGEAFKLMLLTAVSIGVAAVPEGLPAIVTIALTLGAQRMLKRKVLIRKLPAVETLGSVTVICSDKTGTLTENRMTASVVQIADQRLEIPAEFDDLTIKKVGGDADGLSLLMAGAALCNDAIVDYAKNDSSAPVPLGDPTEVALAVAACKFGLLKRDLELALPRVAEVPFSSARKRMTTIHRYSPEECPIPHHLREALQRTPIKNIAFTKGSVDGLLEKSNKLWVNGREEFMSQRWLDLIGLSNETLAGNGMRVLGVAYRHLDIAVDSVDESIEDGLTFLGMVAIIDPPKEEAASAIAKCQTAGIRPVMITGDHPATAQYIASQLGIQSESSPLTGLDLNRLSADELKSAAGITAVYARVSPEHKLNIIAALQQRGNIVAMTGDGVNDAPALKKADIGVAMGVTGTDVAKEAADMVLLDDNFSTIVAAVEEGRVIYDNVRKFIKYVLATNSGEIWLMLIAPFMGMPLPLLPLQILWMNLVTDGLPALALGVEPAEKDTMQRPPYPPQESIFARGLGRHVIWVGLVMGFLSLIAGHRYWRANDPAWQTIIFTTLTLSQMAHVMAIRSERHSLFRIGLFTNLPLLGAVALTALLQFALIYVPLLQTLFKTHRLSAFELMLCIALSSVIFWAVELEKWLGRRK